MQAASDGALGDKLSKMRTLSGTAAHKGGRRVQRSDVSKLTDGKVASPHHNEIQMTPRLSNTIMTAALANDVDFFHPSVHIWASFSLLGFCLSLRLRNASLCKI